MTGLSWLPGSLIVLKWVLNGQEKKVIDRLRSSPDPICRDVVNELRLLALVLETSSRARYGIHKARPSRK